MKRKKWHKQRDTSLVPLQWTQCTEWSKILKNGFGLHLGHLTLIWPKIKKMRKRSFHAKFWPNLFIVGHFTAEFEWIVRTIHSFIFVYLTSSICTFQKSVMNTEYIHYLSLNQFLFGITQKYLILIKYCAEICMF